MLKTAESVTPSHPDKICDRISDAILDFCLVQDPASRVAVETMGGHGMVMIAGEITTGADLKESDIKDIVRRIAGDNNSLQINLIKQSREIAGGVDDGGAGDQGIMVGYASAENEAMIPQETYLSREICRYIYDRYPEDGKTQVTLEDGDIKTVVASFCRVPSGEIKRLIEEWWHDKKNEEAAPGFEILANPAGDWEQGGFAADTGLTGRKLAVDNYGPQIPIGGGAFSGKDATKVDRSGAYMARRIAVDLLKENGFHSVTVKVAYAIGRKEPVMATFRAERIIGDSSHAVEPVEGNVDLRRYDLTPGGIIERLGLRHPQFERTAEWGAFGHGFAWDD